MKLSQNFTKTRKDAPSDEVAKNAQLLIRAGYIHKEIAGAYTFLPLGLKVLNNIVQIIREEMNVIGGQEMEMTALQNPEIWKASDRWDDEKVDNWFKTHLKDGHELGLGFTHEEDLANIMAQHVGSYKDLPRYAYQFQKKFRNEVRAKSGVMRGREFLMKDLYSFSRDKEQHDEFYEKCIEAYHKVFERLGIGDVTYLTFADGGSFADFSHEFQTICEAGEDIIYVDKKKKIAVNQEVFTDEVLAQLELNRDDLEEVKAAESGNIFTLGTKFSEPANLRFADENGQEHPVFMGSYGIGPSRLMGVITELFADDNGLVWPKTVAPARLHIVQIGDSDEVTQAAQDIYDRAAKEGYEVIWDDRDERVGRKLADADLIGIPTRVIVSGKALEKGKFEVKDRDSDEVQLMSVQELIHEL